MLRFPDAVFCLYWNVCTTRGLKKISSIYSIRGLQIWAGSNQKYKQLIIEIIKIKELKLLIQIIIKPKQKYRDITIEEL